jgi:hypothetical protein
MVKARQFFIFLVFTLSGSWIYAQQGNNTLTFTGTIVDAENGNPLSGVHIISTNHAGTTSDIDGNFNLELISGDTVQISHVGYTEYLVPIPDSAQQTIHLTIGLNPSLTELDEIVIHQWPATVKQLKQMILAAEVGEEEQVIIPGSYQGPPKPVQPGIGSPISFLQSKFSKKMRRRQEFLEKRQQLESDHHALRRYSPEFVKEVTGIEDKQELDEFMTFCKLSDVFIAEVSDYDLIVAINQCYKDFKTERPE